MKTADAIPGWNPDHSTLTINQHDRATVMDGIKLGIGMAIAWIVVVPITVFVAFYLLGSLLR